MGMLMQYHRQAAEQANTKPKRARKSRARRGGKAEQTAETVTESLTGADYADLTDEQVAEAYATTIPEGEATERDAQVVELRAVNVYRDTFDADPEAGAGE